MLNKVKVEMLNKVFDILSFGFNFSLLISIISCRICVIHSLSKKKKNCMIHRSSNKEGTHRGKDYSHLDGDCQIDKLFGTNNEMPISQ